MDFGLWVNAQRKKKKAAALNQNEQLFHIPKLAGHFAGPSRSPKVPKRHPLHVGIRRGDVCATAMYGRPGIVVGDAGVYGR